MSAKSVLIVEDDEDLRESVSNILRAEGLAVTAASTGTEGLKTFQDQTFHLALLDFRLPEMGGMELLAAFREKNPQIPVVIMTAHATTRLAIESTQKGAFDFLIKPFKTKDLIGVINRGLQTWRATDGKVEVGTGDEVGNSGMMIGNSRGMQNVYREIGRVADKNVTVLIQGETGTGKDLVARAVHQYSSRRDGPFVPVNCTAIPENLLESELFGHEKGAFTGAVSQRSGRFEQANGGTLFLDEIGDMIPETQVKMLRVLQEKKIRRVGGDEEIPVDVRVIAATHQNLENAMAKGKFRDDLYFRINTAIIDIPPLRDRIEDIGLLVRHFLTLHSDDFEVEPPRFEKGVIKALEEHSWPGNVREMENLIRKMIIHSNGYLLSLEEVKEALNRSTTACVNASDDSESPIRTGHIRKLLLQAGEGEIQNPHAILISSLEEEMVRQALDICGNNQSSACKLLGISRASFREKMEKFGLLNNR